MFDQTKINKTFFSFVVTTKATLFKKNNENSLISSHQGPVCNCSGAFDYITTQSGDQLDLEGRDVTKSM